MSLAISRRVLTSATGLALAASGLVAFAATPSHAAGPAYQMPFSCQQSWLGKTYGGHSPSTLSIDWTRGSSTENQPVLASADGTVSVVKSLTTSYGKYVVIDHGGGSKTLYAHLNDHDVTVGQRVIRGQKIGIVGNTGNSTGAHLHYEQQYQGTVKQSVFNGVPFSMGSTLSSKNCGEVETPPAPSRQWRAQFAVESGGGLFHGVRNPNGTWSTFGNVQNEGGDVPSGVRTTAEAGIDGDTHLVAVSNEGKLYHTVRFADGSWGGFGDVNAAAGQLANVTQVAAASVGAELQVAVVADGKVYHTVRRADGNWTPLAAVGNPVGDKPVTKVAMARTGSDVQLVAVADGVLHHTARLSNGTWLGWGDVSAEGAPAGVADVAIAGTGNDLQVVLTAENGAKQYHGARFFSGEWVFNSLSSVVSGVTVTDVAAAAVNDELQVAFVAADGRVLHTVRQVSGNWTGVGSVDLTGVTGTRTGVSITGTYN
ncbi:peptidoglycan DD-metalloendopeptidase family protein [Streptomyces sp. NPDC058623]|uniref:peptidoglycan DD-metalloendopeptidase family protein n=1 Tax=Streptomyces sp. NPDC058623 TaxID=3346563 RepID=UPI0036468FBF